MLLITLYTILLVVGMLVSQIFDVRHLGDIITRLTTICLAYIMTEVGLEFTVDKTRLKSYGWDYVVAATAAAFPWILCSLYFFFVFDLGWKEAMLLGRFAAPTSAGVLFAMLAAAGLGTTWLFKKARVLAVFDDLDTILLIIPLKIMFEGVKHQLFIAIALIITILAVGYKWLHVLRIPVGKIWLLGYGIVIVLASEYLEKTTQVHLEVLLPAFVLGCLLYNPHDPHRPKQFEHEHTHLEPQQGWLFWVDRLIKGSFMFLVGCSLPKIDGAGISVGIAALHVIALTVISNLGKCFPSFCYRNEASLRERIALSIAMFPRGEVGAGVLLIAMSYGIGGFPTTLAVLSLALNLILTGGFISSVIWLIHPRQARARA